MDDKPSIESLRARLKSCAENGDMNAEWVWPVIDAVLTELDALRQRVAAVPSAGRTDVGALTADLLAIATANEGFWTERTDASLARLRAALERIPALEERVEELRSRPPGIGDGDIRRALDERDALRAQLTTAQSDLAAATKLTKEANDRMARLEGYLQEAQDERDTQRSRADAAEQRAEEAEKREDQTSSLLEKTALRESQIRQRADALAARVEEVKLALFGMGNDGTGACPWCRAQVVPRYAGGPRNKHRAFCSVNNLINYIGTDHAASMEQHDARVRREEREAAAQRAKDFICSRESVTGQSIYEAILGPDAAPTEPGRGEGKSV